MALVRIGGEADKLGNHYEALWRLKLLLELFVGDAETLVLESFDRAQSHGVDAEIRRVREGRLVTEFHSVKRQCTEGIWKPRRMAKQGDNPPLLPLRDRILEDTANRLGVFVSTDPVETLRGLVDAANRSATVDVLKERLRNGSQADRIEVGGLFNDLLSWWSITEAECLFVMKKLRFRSVMEPDLAEELTSVIEREVMREDGTEVDANAVAQHLAEMMRLHLGQPITRQMVFYYLHNAHPGYCGKNLSRVPGAVAQLEGQNVRFVREAQPQLIRGQRIPREDATSLVSHLTASQRQWVMLTGDAGMGKSVVLAQLVDELKAKQIPCLAFRFDTASPVDSMTKLKELLEIKWTPVYLLESIAQRQRCVLIIDQVDALSDVAGRRNSQQWHVLHQVLELARACLHMSIVLACRSFDLRTDADLRLLLKRAPERRDWPDAVTIEVRALSHECVKECLSSEGIDAKSWTNSELEVLSVPLHLGLFLQCKTSDSTPVASLGVLYDRYLEKLRLDAARASPPWDFNAALTPVVECFNEYQRLTLDWSVIESRALRVQAMQLISCGVLSDHSTGDARVVRFFHSTLLDHAIGRLFISGGKRLIDELCDPGERQELSRREHCRQVLSVLRKGSPKDHKRYLDELRALLNSSKVRVHLRLYLIHWLNALPDPSLEEWRMIQDCADTPPEGRTTEQQRLTWRVLIIRSGTWSSVPWFDLLHTQGLWLKWLMSKDPVAMPQLPWMLGRQPLLKFRSNEIVGMLRTEPWASTVQGQRCAVELICGGEFYASESTAHLFADAFTLDWPGLADSGMWKHHLKDLVNVSETASVRVLKCILSERLRFKKPRSRIAYEPRPLNWRQLLKERWNNRLEARKWDYLAAKPTIRMGTALLWVKQATRWLKSKLPACKKRDKPSYAQLKGFALLRSRLAAWMFPPADPHRIETHCLVEFLTACAVRHPLEYCQEAVGFIEGLKAKHGDTATGAITHLWMPHGGRLHEISDALIHGLRTALTKLGKASPPEFDVLVDRLLSLKIPGLENLIMQAWAGCPEHSANRVASFLKAAPLRLFAQPGVWSGGNALSFYARTLLQATAPLMSDSDFSEVERLVLETEDPRRTSKALRERNYSSEPPDLNDAAARKQHLHYLKRRHSGQHLLLSVLPSERLSVAGRKKLTVWRDQYGEPDLKPPSDTGFRFIGTPSKLSDEVLVKMSDAQLLEAMRKYPPTRKPDEPLEWSHSAIVSQISKLAASQKPRFLGILRGLPSDVDDSYRHAVIEGLLGREHDGFVAAEINELTEAEVTEIITVLAPRAVPTIAKHICWSLSRKLKPYPGAWLDVLIDLALHHPDPAGPGDDESISVRVAGQRIRGDEVHANGMNVVRGAACHALATALFGDDSVANALRPHMPSLLGDPSNAVRSAMIELLIAWLNVSRDEAVPWFVELVKGRDVLLHCSIAEHFLFHACHSHLDQLGPLIDRMTHSMDDDMAPVLASGNVSSLSFS